MQRMRIAVVAGGRSPEYEVSLLSGAEVVRHLDRRRYDVLPIHVDRDGVWHTAPRFLEAGETLAGMQAKNALTMGPGGAVEFCREKRIDCVFLALHGPYGEDGTVQGLLELYRMPYTGPGVAASAIAMDKLRCREVLGVHGVPMPEAFVSPYVLDDPRSDLLADDIDSTIGFPAFLKVDCSGSTLGVARAMKRSGFSAALGEIRQPGVGLRWLAESALTGIEVTCACLGNWTGEVRALPPVEIRPRQEAYFTYKAKYTAGASDELCPPPSLDAAAVEAVQDLGARCHRLLCCDGMSRTDMIVTESGPQVLEVNTIPGLTRLSLLPKAAAAAGLDFGQLVDRLVELAMARAPTSRVRVAS